MKPFEQPNLFEHGRENTQANTEIYESQKHRIRGNTEIVFKCLLSGMALTGDDCMNGIKCEGMSEPIKLREYRKRFGEISDAGFKMEEEILPSGMKRKWFPKDRIEEYRMRWEKLKAA